jgi:hypothetical protein
LWSLSRAKPSGNIFVAGGGAVSPALSPEAIKNHEAALQRAMTAWIVAGLFFMLLPGTFLGAWNLIAISAEHAATRIDPAWIQAHGHAQIFGWVGSFVLGIGFYSLSKMGGAGRFAISRAWTSWSCWVAGVLLRWTTNLWQWEWRWMLPASALLELAGFAIFFVTVRRHRGESVPPTRGASLAWIRVVMAGTAGFLLSLLANLALAVHAAATSSGVAIPHVWDQRLLALYTWAFPVVTIWGFSARWLPVFLGIRTPDDRLLLSAVAVNACAVVAALGGWWNSAAALSLVAGVMACVALNLFRRTVRPPKVSGVHSSFPVFVRIAYGWLLVSAILSVAAAVWDTSGGLWGASRHTLTVGFISTMIFAIGQRVLPAFSGMRVLFSPALMFLALALLNIGCFIRAGSEIGAYEGYAPALWTLLPVSAVIEMAAVTIFAVNLLVTFRQTPPHVQQLAG